MRSTVRFLASLTGRAPVAIVAVSLALTAVLGSLAGRVEVATGNEGFAPDAPEIAAAERIADKFGDGSTESPVQVIIRGGDVITAEGLRAAVSAVEAIRASEVGALLADRPDRPGVFHYLAPVERSAAAQGIPLEQLDDTQVKSLFAEAMDGDGEFDAPPEQAAFLLKLVSSDYDPGSVSAGAGMVLAFVSSPTGADAEAAFEAQVEAEQDMEDRLAGLDTGLEVRPFSFVLLTSGADDFTQEVGRLFGMAFGVILVILLFVYWLAPRGHGWLGSTRRTVADTMVTLLTIVMAIGWMQGIGYLLEQVGVIEAFSAPTQIVPILLIGLGVDYAIHLTARYREEVGGGAGVAEAVSRAVTTVGVALVLATVTTVIGFLTNLFNPVPALKDFGILSAVGITVSFLLMLTFVPAVRLLLDRRAERKGSLPVDSLQDHGSRWLPRLMEGLSVLAERAAVPTLVVAALLGGLGYYGFTRLETRFSFTDFLPSDSPHVLTLEVLADEFGGGVGEQTQILVEPQDGTIDGSLHNAFVAADRDLAGIDDVDTIAIPAGVFPNAASPVALLGQALASPQGAPAAVMEAAAAVGLGPDLTVPAGADATPLYVALLDSLPGSERVISIEDGRVDGVLWDVTTTAGEEVGALRTGLDQAFQPVREAGASAVATSQNVIGDVVVKGLTESQASSLFVTIAVAALVLIVSFAVESRRWLLGLLTIAPVGLVVLWTYGLMYATGIPFGPVTATLSALAIGIGVPFTIHIARRFQEDRRDQPNLEEAMRSTMRHTGGALAGSAFTTMAGFGILVSSSLVPFRQMGQVTVYAIGLSLVAAVLVLPSMLAIWDRRAHR